MPFRHIQSCFSGFGLTLIFCRFIRVGRTYESTRRCWALTIQLRPVRVTGDMAVNRLFSASPPKNRPKSYLLITLKILYVDSGPLKRINLVSRLKYNRSRLIVSPTSTTLTSTKRLSRKSCSLPLQRHISMCGFENLDS